MSVSAMVLPFSLEEEVDVIHSLLEAAEVASTFLAEANTFRVEADYSNLKINYSRQGFAVHGRNYACSGGRNLPCVM